EGPRSAHVAVVARGPPASAQFYERHRAQAVRFAALGPGPEKRRTRGRVGSRSLTVAAIRDAQGRHAEQEEEDGEADEDAGEPTKVEASDGTGQEECKLLLLRASGERRPSQPAGASPSRKASARLFRCCLPCRGDGGGGSGGSGGGRSGGGGRGERSARSSGSGASASDGKEHAKDSGIQGQDRQRAAAAAAAAAVGKGGARAEERAGVGRGRDRGDGVGGRGGGGGGVAKESSLASAGAGAGASNIRGKVNATGGGGGEDAMALAVTSDGQQRQQRVAGNGRRLQAALAKQEEDDEGDEVDELEAGDEQRVSVPAGLGGARSGARSELQHQLVIGSTASHGRGRTGRHRAGSSQQHPQSLPHIREERKRNGSNGAVAGEVKDENVEGALTGEGLEQPGEDDDVEEEEEEEEEDEEETEEQDDVYSADEAVLIVPLTPLAGTPSSGKYLQQAASGGSKQPHQQPTPPPPVHPKYHRNRRHTLANV
uniref:Uncharacterized protein n=1 Tax=Anopheles atroparvus TaxID=41427 RepID=A0AAG5DXP7_ANOAO